MSDSGILIGSRVTPLLSSLIHSCLLRWHSLSVSGKFVSAAFFAYFFGFGSQDARRCSSRSKRQCQPDPFRRHCSVTCFGATSGSSRLGSAYLLAHSWFRSGYQLCAVAVDVDVEPLRGSRWTSFFKHDWADARGGLRGRNSGDNPRGSAFAGAEAIHASSTASAKPYPQTPATREQRA